MKTTFSTIEVARLLKVSVKSVQRWIDHEQLIAGRTPGGHRRICLDDLIQFLKKQKLPIPGELSQSVPQILVVDDEPKVADHIARQIRARHPDWEIAKACDGFTAGGMIQMSTPDVVLLDLKMPTMDGYEVCRRISKTDSVRKTAVIAISPRHSPSVTKTVLECGAIACLSKPINIEALLAEIEKILH